MTANTAPENCIDIVRQFSNGLERVGLLTDVQLIGGVGSAALANRATVILPDQGLVVAPPDLYLPSIRDDGNRRDLDVLVLSDDQDRIDTVEGIAEETVGDKLEISVFGLREAGYAGRQLRHPWWPKAFKTFTGERFASDNRDMAEDIFPFDIPIHEDGPDRTLTKVAFPFGVWMHPEAMDGYWTLVGDLAIPTPHPAAAVMNYLTRSMSGLRWKDEFALNEDGEEITGKVPKMADNILEQVPDYADWIKTGPGATLLELARIFHSLQGPSDFREAEPIILGNGAIRVEPMPIRALLEHDAFMLRDRRVKTQENVLAWARVKSAVLSKAESNGEIVRLYQKYAERLFDGITKNK